MLNLGIIGCGNIAGVMADSLKGVEGINIAAVASRDPKKAKAFAKAHCPEAKAYGSYSKLAEAKDIDLVYITSPNTYHYECAIMCLKAHKNILVEKPFTMSRAEADSIFSEAKNRNLFVCEAMWTAFMPLHRQILDWIEEGRIGAVKYISANLGYDIEDIPRLTDPALGGGSYPDLGVYPSHLALSILGNDLIPTDVHARRYSTGVDRDVSYVLEQPGEGALCSFYVTMSAKTDRNGGIVGEKGYIRIRNINNYEKIALYDTDDEMLEECEAEGLNGYVCEMLSCKKAIEEGRIQCDEMPWNRTAALVSLGDRIRGMM